jgi:hypothetical protein
MNYKSILRIAQELEESGYSNYAKDILDEAIELQNISVQSAEAPIPEPNQEEVTQTDVDKFLGAVFYNLASHNNLKFNDQGTLELESIRAIVNSFEQELTNADMS